MPSRYRPGLTITVNDRMQVGYIYALSVPPGKDFDPAFTPRFSPQEMLELGVFEGKYCNDCRSELPASWFENAKTADRPDPALNFFGVKSRQSLQTWQEKGWIIGDDPRGWFQWYCRYWLGRRDAAVDMTQIKRWRAFTRHAGQIRAHCAPGELACRPRQRQALLQWAYDPFL